VEDFLSEGNTPWCRRTGQNSNPPANLDEATLQLIQEKLVERSRAKVNREYDIADDIRDELRDYNVNVNDRTREWRT
jgi:cysteinyl-tRNA synthetase